MKILILANNDVGLYNFRKELICALLEEHEVLLALPYGERINSLLDWGCEFIDVPIERRGVNPIQDLILLSKYKKILEREKPDFVITYTIKPNVYGGIICSLKKTPYAVNITGLGTAFQKRGMLQTLVTVLYKFGLRKSCKVFFENEENRQLFIRKKIVGSETTYRLNGAGVNLEQYPVLEYPTNGTTGFLFIARVMKEKGIEELIYAMKRLVSEGIKCSLTVVGPYEEDYSLLFEECEKEGWLQYKGYQKDVRPFIKEAHCFVLPSWHEGMANTNLECAASGRPVITSSIAGCREAVLDECSGYLCEKQNAEDLYSKMMRFVLLNHEEQKNMGIMGRRHMEQYFDKKIVVRETLEQLGLEGDT